MRLRWNPARSSPLTTLVDRAVAVSLITLMAASVVNVLWQVFTRFVLGSPSSFTEELARYLLVWIGMLGAAYAAGRNMHLTIDILPQRLTGHARRRLEAFIRLGIVAFSLTVMVVGGMRLVTLTLSLGQTSAALGIPLGYVYFVVPLSGLLMAWYAVRGSAVRSGETGRGPTATGGAA